MFRSFVCVACLLFTLMSLGTPTPSSAAPSAAEQERIAREQQQILRQDEERRREEERRRKLRELSPPSPEEQRPIPPKPKNERCINVDKIHLSENAVLSTDDIDEALSKFVGKCLSMGEIENLLTIVNDTFRDAGFITTRGYLQPQNLQDGVLEITIVEGTVQDIRLNEDTLEDRTQIWWAFPNTTGDILSIRDVEQGLDQMNRLSSNDAKMQISPGEKAGESLVTVTNEVSNPIRLTVGRENSGSTSTGKLLNTASLNIDNMMRLNDAWMLNYNRTARNYGTDRRSESLSGTYSIPFGYSTLSYSGSYYAYDTLVEGDVQDFQTSGTSTTHKVELSNIIHRDQNSKTRLDFSVAAKQSRNFIEDVFVQASSRKLSVGRIAAAHSNRILDGVASFEIGFEKGLRVLGALRDDPDQATDDPKAQFRKWTFESNYQRPFELSAQRFSWSSSTSWQYAPDTLFGTERFGVGGQYSVRGFRDDTLAGDTGGYWRNELSWTPDISQIGSASDFVNYVQPYAAYDWGWIKTDHSEDRERGTLSGMALGIRTAGKYFSLSAEWAHGLHSPDFLEKNGHEINFRAVFHL